MAMVVVVVIVVVSTAVVVVVIVVVLVVVVVAMVAVVADGGGGGVSGDVGVRIPKRVDPTGGQSGGGEGGFRFAALQTSKKKPDNIASVKAARSTGACTSPDASSIVSIAFRPTMLNT